MPVIGDGEEVMVKVFMLDDHTYDAVDDAVREFLIGLTDTFPCRAEYHDGFGVSDFG